MSSGATELNDRTPADPFYAIRRERRDYDFHSVSGRGMYCSREHKLFDPPSGLEVGDPCPLCGEITR